MNPRPADLVASMIAAIEGEYAGDPEDRALFIALALEEGGYLAPAPLREEWGTRFGDHVVEGRTNAEYPFFWKGMPPPGVNVHRHVTEWEPVNE